ncbi:DUF5723 family protein [Cytophaga aurantiaca]|uniref:DUF5723 family protein n=1 Tax=Cytophaga aurantiaca TaxID=29530 RepID=UPI00036AC7A6|nr:DUF5723 family protein [Cytophaga aurantiaca]
MKKLLLILSLLSASNYTVFGQAEGSVVSATARAGVATTFVTDYQSIGINPANLGLRSKYETKHITFGFLEMNASAFAKGVTKQQMNDYIFSGDTLSPAGQTNAANLFANNNISANIDIMVLGIAFQYDKLGGLAFSVNDVMRGNGNLSQNFTSFAFSGALSTQYFDQLRTNNGTTVANDPNQYAYYNSPAGGNGIDAGLSTAGVSLGQVFKGTNVKAHYYRTFNAAYGREVYRNDVFNVSAGVGLKYVMGYYYMDIQSKDGVLQGNVADNPTFSSLSTNFNIPDKDNGGNFINPVGQGFGFDIGATAEIYEKLKVGISLVNVGGIKYTKNTYEVKDTTINELKFDQSTADAFNQTVYWKEGQSFTAKLPTTLRFGASIALLEKRLEVGGDIIVPLNKAAGNINTAMFAVGGDFYLKRWIKLSSGASIGGNYANTLDGYSTHVCVPFGFTLIAGENGGWEVGVSTRDIISLIDANGKSPLYSAGLCMFRFRV